MFLEIMTRFQTSIMLSWNVDKELRMDPPIQTEYFLSGGATIFTLTALGARAVISLLSLASIPVNIVEPPDNTVLVYKSRRMSTSHFWIESYVSLWIPSLSLPIKLGLKSGSEARNRSAPMVITCPSGSSYCFSTSCQRDGLKYRTESVKQN